MFAFIPVVPPVSSAPFHAPHPRRTLPRCAVRPPSSKPAPSVLTSPLLPRLVPLARAAWRLAWLALMSQLAPTDPSGRYIRPTSSLRSTPDQPSPTSTLTLYVGVACPWCHRTTLANALLRPPNVRVIELSPGPDGLWLLPDGTRLRDRYLQLDPNYSGRFTAPLLVDDVATHIVSNESADIPAVLSAHTGASLPVALSSSVSVCLRPTTDTDATPHVDSAAVASLCDRLYTTVNDGVYRCGFATSQLAYDEAETELFQTLDHVEQRLSTTRFLCADAVVTEADIRLFPTVFRFDAVYALLFRVSRKSIRHDYPAISRWLRDMYNLPNVADTCDLSATLSNYFSNLFPLNASAIVPHAPTPDLSPLHPPPI